MLFRSPQVITPASEHSQLVAGLGQVICPGSHVCEHRSSAVASHCLVTCWKEAEVSFPQQVVPLSPGLPGQGSLMKSFIASVVSALQLYSHLCPISSLISLLKSTAHSRVPHLLFHSPWKCLVTLSVIEYSAPLPSLGKSHSHLYLSLEMRPDSHHLMLVDIMCQKKHFLLQNFSPGCCYKLKMCPLGSLLSEWQYFLFVKKN